MAALGTTAARAWAGDAATAARGGQGYSGLPWDRGEVGPRSSSCRGRGGAGSAASAGLHCGKLLNAAAASQRQRREAGTGGSQLSRHRGDPGPLLPRSQRRRQPWAPSGEMNPFPAPRDPALWAGGACAPCSCPQTGGWDRCDCATAGTGPAAHREQGTHRTPNMGPSAVSPVQSTLTLMRSPALLCFCPGNFCATAGSSFARVQLLMPNWP